MLRLENMILGQLKLGERQATCIGLHPDKWETFARLHKIHNVQEKLDLLLLFLSMLLNMVAGVESEDEEGMNEAQGGEEEGQAGELSSQLLATIRQGCENMEASSRTFPSLKRKHYVGYKERKMARVSEIPTKHEQCDDNLEEFRPMEDEQQTEPEVDNDEHMDVKANDIIEEEEEDDDKTKYESESESPASPDPEGWGRVNSLPAGWTLKKSQTKVTGLENVCYVRDPNGKTFQGRRAALKFMIKSGADVDEIEIMRSMLDYEGWQIHPLLPEGWRLKSEKKNETSSLLFLTPQVDLLRGIGQAEADMLAHDSYSEGDLDNLRALQAEHSRAMRETSFEWKDNDRLPAGWKERRTESGKVFLLAANSETQFLSKRLALQHLIQQGRPEEERARMREAMQVDGWLSSRLLPEGWMFKEQGKNNDRKLSQLLTSEGAHFKSFRNAIEYMRASYTYSEDDIKGLEFLVEELSGARRTQSDEWLETEGLPGGWKYKVTKVDICGPFKKSDFWNIFDKCNV